MLAQNRLVMGMYPPPLYSEIPVRGFPWQYSHPQTEHGHLSCAAGTRVVSHLSLQKQFLQGRKLLPGPCTGRARSRQHQGGRGCGALPCLHVQGNTGVRHIRHLPTSRHPPAAGTCDGSSRRAEAGSASPPFFSPLQLDLMAQMFSAP